MQFKTLSSWLALSLLSATSQWQTADAAPKPKTPNESTCDYSAFQIPQVAIDTYNGALGAGLPDFVALETFLLIQGLQGGWTPGLKGTETPVTSRIVRLIDNMDWACTAAYSSTWLDSLSMDEPIVRAPKNFTQENGKTIDYHTSSTRLLCMVHAWAAVSEEWDPNTKASLSAVLDPFFGTLDLTYGLMEEVEDLFFNSGKPKKAAAKQYAADNCYSPKVMGQIIARNVVEYGRKDGFNAYGDKGRNGKACSHNCRPYTDTTNYKPLKKKKGVKSKYRWTPMLEDDDRGYFTRQEHVTPHIGSRAKRAVLSDYDFEMRGETFGDTTNFNWDKEAREVASRLAATATDDLLKAKIEFYDDKIAVIFKIIAAVASYGASFEQLCNFSIGLISGEYDSVLVAWNIKVKNDLVRPTTWIQEEMADETFSTYAGPGNGVDTIQGRDFQAYVRVMPHSEYMSGSACICQALADFTDEWMGLTHGELNGGNAMFTFIPGGSIAVPIAMDETGREPPFVKGSSRTEPGETPSQNLTLVAPTMTDLRNQCGESRLDGGMHFARSVPDSYRVCEGIGTQAAGFAIQLLGTGGWKDDPTGDVPDSDNDEEADTEAI